MSRNESLVVAVRSMAILAVHPDGALTTDRLGELVGSNPVVVRRVLGRLRWDGVVETRRGPHGGCALALDPARIPLGRLHRALHETNTFVGVRPSDRILAAAIGAAEAAYLDELDRWTLADLIQGTSSFSGHS